jgi:subtilisin family serine protease
MVLPRGGASEASGADWIIGARAGSASEEIAARFGARPIDGLPAFTVARTRARAFAAALKREQLLTWAEADVRASRQSAYEGRLGQWARVAVVPADFAWPAPGGVPVAVLDDRVDGAVSDLSQQTSWLNNTSVADSHGTMVASTISAVVGRGPIVGVFPGTPILSYGLTSFSCADVARGIDKAITAGARVINMSIGTESDCYTMYAAIQRAYAKDVLSVAAAGNEFSDGNPTEYPAAFPHVVSVAATDSRGRVSDFSNANAAVDVSAPGVDVPVDVPLKFDTEDNAADGVTTASGTSFSSPITAGAAAWIAASRPELKIGQIADLLKKGAKDIAPKGYDRNTGFGLINIPASLALPAPTIDPQEPNDSISLVNGTALGTKAPLLWNGAETTSLLAKIDQFKDPLDIYRIAIPARSAAKISVTPKFGGVDLAVYSSSAKSSTGRPYRVAYSKRGGTSVDRVTVRNSLTKPRSFYVVVSDHDGKLLNAEYTLRVGR